ncbi:hypothetical protein [Amycolatopsis sp. EV170708-02-1]|uniref:hypothetical protein n=1 Tax=Amycolatopsis sp. EV170708-02-1 TaxID=2919322 RepID=UPI001F0C4839|nr:hypothetical protein [Amycolatopsis sp. EV170708-02-1]UMO99982.1 hypothetical protein MJQ72_26115 [Amycolatopsis sp. EV170708-02-1]
MEQEERGEFGEPVDLLALDLHRVDVVQPDRPEESQLGSRCRLRHERNIHLVIRGYLFGVSLGGERRDEFFRLFDGQTLEFDFDAEFVDRRGLPGNVQPPATRGRRAGGNHSGKALRLQVERFSGQDDARWDRGRRGKLIHRREVAEAIRLCAAVERPKPTKVTGTDSDQADVASSQAMASRTGSVSSAVPSSVTVPISAAASRRLER